MSLPFAGAAAADAPPAMWRGVTALHVTCLVQTPNGIDAGSSTTNMCDAVRAAAAESAPVAVSVAGIGGEALAPGIVTLLVHANAAPLAGHSVTSMTIRPFRNDGGVSAQLFTAAPQAFVTDDAAARNGAIRRILAETLPWQAGARATGDGIPTR